MIRSSIIALGLATAALSGLSAAPAQAQAATPSDTQGAQAFVADLANRTFGVLKTGDRAAARAQFRALLQDNFAIPEIGNHLIRRYRATVTPAQLAAYQQALPEFIINTYTDRLFDFSDAKVTVVRAAPHGGTGLIDVYSTVSHRGGAPYNLIWGVEKTGGKFRIDNVTVNGVNLAITQEADFSSYIQKNGFDALVAFLKRGGGAQR